MKTSKTKQSVLIAILVIALVTVFMPARTDTAQASVSDAQYAALKGTWATGSSRYPGYGPQNYVRFTKYKVNYYQFTVHTVTEAVEALSEAFLNLGCGGVEIFDPKDILNQDKHIRHFTSIHYYRTIQTSLSMYPLYLMMLTFHR